jgi:hypothetical protein
MRHLCCKPNALVVGDHQPMHWANSSTDRVVLPRKAAFFSCVAAEAVSGGFTKHAGNLWLLAVQLYGRGDTGVAYGWGTLRAACLSALSATGTNPLSLEAAEQLLSLLGELTPAVVQVATVLTDVDATLLPVSDEIDTSDHSNKEVHSSKEVLSVRPTPQEMRSTPNAYTKQLQITFKQKKTYSPFLSQQAKWASDDPVYPLLVPLGDTSPLALSVTVLKCVWSLSDLSACTRAQNECLNRINSLRRSLATPSSELVDFPTIYGDNGQAIPPLYVVAAVATEEEARLEVAKTKRTSTQSGEGALSTFFNPFEDKRKRQGGASVVMIVAEEEERAISVTFGNRLAVPLEVTGCQLQFSGRDTSRVMATKLSYILPANAPAFNIHLPFTVLARPEHSGEIGEQGESFIVNGIEMTCLGRSFSLPILLSSKLLGQSRSGFPDSVSEYQHSNSRSSFLDDVNADSGFPVQVYPCQPRLRVLFGESRTPLETLSIDLADGQLYTSPPLRLECYAGPSERGCVEQIEIHVGGIPGLAGLNKKLLDTNAPSIAQSEEDFIGNMFDKDLSSPLKARILAEKLSLEAVNCGGGSTSESDNVLRIQIVATHGMTRRLKKDAKVILRLRYRGPANNSTEVWRNHEIVMSITRSKGPRITSISFEPDINEGCFFRALLGQLNLKTPGIPKVNGLNEHNRSQEANLNVGVGRSASVNVCSGEIGCIVTVSNGTGSKILLVRENGHISSISSRQIDEVILRPFESVNLPMALKRMVLLTKNSTTDDLVRELISSTTLAWRSIEGNGEEASGQVRIPPDCLRELVRKNPSLVSKMCDVPCIVELSVNKTIPSTIPLRASLGSPGYEIRVQVKVADWLSMVERKKCEISMGLFCICERNDADNISLPKDHVWAGKQRHKSSLAAKNLDHGARIIFCSPGSYVVSACARITHELSEEGVEEIWWAPVAQRIVVSTGDVPPSQ